MRFFSSKSRPTHYGPYPLEVLERQSVIPDLAPIPDTQFVSFDNPQLPENIVHSMRKFQALMDAIRNGLVNSEKSNVTECPNERSNHLKAHGYFYDASQIGICALSNDMLLDEPIVNFETESIAKKLSASQGSQLDSSFDVMISELKEAMHAPGASIAEHTHAIVLLYEFPRDPDSAEPGTDWIRGSQTQRATLRATESAVILASYIRLLGYEACAHSYTATDVHLNKMAVAAGLAEIKEVNGRVGIENPYLGDRFGLAAITTQLELTIDQPLLHGKKRKWWKGHGPAWWVGKGHSKSHFNREPFRSRRYVDGQFPFETLKRQESPTTFMDETRIPRVPKRADMFTRAAFGDMGKKAQKASESGHFMYKSATATAPNLLMSGLALMQQGEANDTKPDSTNNRQVNSNNIKATAYFLGADAVGLSRCPDWVYYSHDDTGTPIKPYHSNAISIVIDQGYETMEGASGDDWIACAQSMRAYMRFALIGGIMAEHIRNLGYEARSHSAYDGDVLQPPLLLLSGLGEVSRIGEVVLNPFLGPRLKSGVVTTNMPFVHDSPINFGLQSFCGSCNKCARERPSGAITSGPKLMFNGYEIWKSDSQKCTQYRITQEGGSMCGRCMKTCPWNLEGIFKEKPFRWMAMHVPWLAKSLAKLDDFVGNGKINPVKKWWWDLELRSDGSYQRADKEINKRDLQKHLELNYEDQTLAVYPANLAPPPYPYPFAMDREKAIEAYKGMLTAKEYQHRLHEGNTENLSHKNESDKAQSPIIQVKISKAEKMTDEITKYELASIEVQSLPPFTAGAHIDVVVAPEYFRQYSLSGNPEDCSKYQIAVFREKEGRGGSKLLHRIFFEGREIFISKPINHFSLKEKADETILFGGGIGITPLLAMGHRLDALGAKFELHYSGWSRKTMGFLGDIESLPWKDNIYLHITDEATRIVLEDVIPTYREGVHLYTCGPNNYMQSILDTAERMGWPEDAVHKEFFAVPDSEEYVDYDFYLNLAKSTRKVFVPAGKAATEALADAGIHVDIKCSDGLCAACACGLLDGEVEHRDYVLSKEERKTKIILCSSRGAKENGIVSIDL